MKKIINPLVKATFFINSRTKGNSVNIVEVTSRFAEILLSDGNTESIVAASSFFHLIPLFSPISMRLREKEKMVLREPWSELMAWQKLAVLHIVQLKEMKKTSKVLLNS